MKIKQMNSKMKEYKIVRFEAITCSSNGYKLIKIIIITWFKTKNLSYAKRLMILFTNCKMYTTSNNISNHQNWRKIVQNTDLFNILN